MRSHVLVVVTSDIGADEINSTIGDRFGDDTEVQVVAPASGLSRLDWLTNAEDDARANAATRANEVSDAIPADSFESTVGDTEPLRAIADALRTFPAEQIVVVTKTDDDVSWLEHGVAAAAEERFDVPVTHLVVG
jgi:hypothetical protein